MDTSWECGSLIKNMSNLICCFLQNSTQELILKRRKNRFTTPNNITKFCHILLIRAKAIHYTNFESNLNSIAPKLSSWTQFNANNKPRASPAWTSQVGAEQSISDANINSYFVMNRRKGSSNIAFNSTWCRFFPSDSIVQVLSSYAGLHNTDIAPVLLFHNLLLHWFQRTVAKRLESSLLSIKDYNRNTHSMSWSINHNLSEITVAQYSDYLGIGRKHACCSHHVFPLTKWYVFLYK